MASGAKLNVGASQTLGALNGTTGSTVTLGSNALTIGSSNNLSGNFAGVISGSGGSVVKAGTGTETLSGNNTYTGNTTVNAGTLLVTNTTGSATGTGTVTVNSGGTLSGSGTAGQGIISGNVTVASGGNFASAGSTNGLTLSGGLNLQAGSTSNFTLLAPTGNGTPLINVSAGNLTVGSHNTINLTAGAGFGAGTYDLFHYATGSDPYANFTLATSSLNGSSCALQDNTTNHKIDLTVAPTTTTTTVTVSSNPSVFGQLVTFTATVTGSPGTPTGTVTFKDGSTSLATASLSSGTCTFSTASLPAATHTITANYSGDATFGGSTGTLTGGQTVGQASTTTTVTSSSGGASVFGQSVTFTATVSPQIAGTPTGVVTFQDNGTSIGTGALNQLTSDVATFTASSSVINGVSTHTITAVYAGDTNFSTSTSANFPQTVNKASTTTTVTASTGSTAVFGQSVTFTATVSPQYTGTPSGGTVTFQDNGTSIGTGLSSGSGTWTWTPGSYMVAGTNPITAIYDGVGDANFSASTSAAFNQTVTRASTSTTITSSENPSYFEDVVTFTATVTNISTGATPTGSVTFKDNGATLSSGVLSNGTATYTTSSLTGGSHAISVVFSNTDGNFNNSSPVSLTQTVQESTTTSLVPSTTAPVFGQPVTFTVTVSSEDGPSAGTPVARRDVQGQRHVATGANAGQQRHGNV